MPNEKIKEQAESIAQIISQSDADKLEKTILLNFRKLHLLIFLKF